MVNIYLRQNRQAKSETKIEKCKKKSSKNVYSCQLRVSERLTSDGGRKVGRKEKGKEKGREGRRGGRMEEREKGEGASAYVRN